MALRTFIVFISLYLQQVPAARSRINVDMSSASPTHWGNEYGSYYPGQLPPPGSYPPVAVAVPVAVAENENAGRMQAILEAKIGARGEPLIPALVPLPGETYVLKNKEKMNAMEIFTSMAESNQYEWELDEVQDDRTGRHKVDLHFAKLRGKWTSNSFGHKSVHVLNQQGVEVFKIRAAKHTHNPLKLRWSFRILPPGSKDNADSMFTITKDLIGNGWFWLKHEWTIYRGRMKDNGRGQKYDVVYYATGSYMGWDFKIYHNKEEFDNGRPPVASISQKLNAGAILSVGFLPDKFKLTVHSGEDSALLLAMSTIMDMYHDTKEAEQSNSHSNHTRYRY